MPRLRLTQQSQPQMAPAFLATSMDSDNHAPAVKSPKMMLGGTMQINSQ